MDNSWTQCLSGKCNFDQRVGGDLADVGDVSRLVEIAASGSDPNGICIQPVVNQPPVVSSLTFSQNLVNENARNFSAQASDPEGTVVSCELTCYAGAPTFTNLDCEIGATCTYPGTGSYISTLSAKDRDGVVSSVVTASVTLSQFTNHPPTLTGSICTATSGDAVFQTQCYATGQADSDGDVVTCTTSCGNGDTPTQNVSCSQPVACTYLDAGTYTVTTTPYDSHGQVGQSRTTSVTVNSGTNNQFCGNSTTDSGETCDDGNAITESCTYGLTSCSVCNATCQQVAGNTAYCSNHIVDAQEQCDDGNALSNDGCSNTCQNEIPSYTTPSFTLKFGGGILNNPRDLDIDPATGNVAVPDSNNHRVVFFNPNTGAVVSTLGPSIPGTNSLVFPESICFSPVSSRFAIVDQGNSRVVVMSSSIQLSHIVGSFGQGDGEFDQPEGCVFDRNENLYIVDDTDRVDEVVNHRVEKFNPIGVYQNSWGRRGVQPGEFRGPRGIAVDAEGLLYVTDLENNRIQKFTQDGTSVRFWDGTFFLPVNQPAYVAVDANDRIYAVEFGLSQIRSWTQSGVDAHTIGSIGDGDGQFHDTVGIGVTPNGVIFTSDFTRDDIQKFSP